MICWIPGQYTQTPGRVGLTRCPGAGSDTRDSDLASIAEAGVTHVVCLQEPHELGRLVPSETLETRAAAVVRLGMKFTHEAVEDCAAPTLVQVTRLVENIVHELELGGRVVIHCWTGLGRAGTVAACVLSALGMSADSAIALVRWVRPGAIQTSSQEDLIREYASSRERQA